MYITVKGVLLWFKKEVEFKATCCTYDHEKHVQSSLWGNAVEWLNEDIKQSENIVQFKRMYRYKQEEGDGVTCGCWCWLFACMTDCGEVPDDDGWQGG